jgi:membrane fusion protein, multidrug efflux system
MINLNLKNTQYPLQFLLICTALMLMTACGKKTVESRAAVTVAKPLSQAVHAYQLFDGTVSPLLTVNLDARVPGYLNKILFQDGGMVKKDDLLFVIEQDQYLQQVKLNQAIYDEAKIEHARQKHLLKENATSQASVDKALSSLLQAEANLKLAKINFGYTEVRAPFDGLMGRHLIDVGSYLGSNPQGVKLATIQKIRPIYIYFAINERDLLKFKATHPVDLEHKTLVNTLPVYAQLQGEKGYPHQGTLDYSANLVSTDTGSLQLRAEMPNDDLSLIPGLYARVLVQSSETHPAILIPFLAVLGDQQGNYVYILDAQKKATRQNITLGQKFNHLVEVTKGLDANQVVVINGFINLSEGQLADPKEVALEPLVSQ